MQHTEWTLIGYLSQKKCWNCRGVYHRQCFQFRLFGSSE